MSKKNPSGLTDQNESFGRHLVLDPERIGYAAYRKAYPSCKSVRSATVNAAKLLTNANMRVFIANLEKPAFDKYDISMERINREKARIAFFDPEKLVHADTGIPKKIHEIDADTRAAIAGLEVTVAGDKEGMPIVTNKIKISNKNQMLDQLSKQAGMYEADNFQKVDRGLGMAAEELLQIIKEGFKQEEQKKLPAPK